MDNCDSKVPTEVRPLFSSYEDGIDHEAEIQFVQEELDSGDVINTGTGFGERMLSVPSHWMMAQPGELIPFPTPLTGPPSDWQTATNIPGMFSRITMPWLAIRLPWPGSAGTAKPGPRYTHILLKNWMLFLQIIPTYDVVDVDGLEEPVNLYTGDLFGVSGSRGL